MLGSQTVKNINRAIEYLRNNQREDGSWSGELSSRLFESSMIFIVIKSIANDWDENSISKLESYVLNSLPDISNQVVNSWESCLQSCSTDINKFADLRERDLYKDIFIRKTIIVHTLLAWKKVKVDSPYTLSALFDGLADKISGELNIKDWAYADLLACYIILATLLKKKISISVIEDLKSRQLSDGSWYHNPITSTISVLAMSALGENDKVSKGLLYLKEIQQSDGGFSYCEIPVWDTAFNLLAIPANRKESYIDDAINYILRSRNSDGGWGFYPGLESENDTTAVVISALVMHGKEDYLKKSLEYLRRAQLENGLWPVWRKTERASLEVVAHIVTAINSFEFRPVGLSTDTAKLWLAKQRTPEGIWRAEWSINIPYSIYSVLEALSDQKSSYLDTVSFILAHRNEDGGYSLNLKSEHSCPTATANVIMILSLFGNKYKDELLVSLEYLNKSITDEGTWPSEREVIGPRPLRYAIQASTHAYCLRALISGEKYL